MLSKSKSALTAMCFVALLAALFAAPPALEAQHGARVIHRNLAELVNDAGIVVHGRVLSVRAEPHPQYGNLMTVVVSLEVLELLKGQGGAPLTYRQFVWDQRDAQSKLGYKVGDEVLLLLTTPHPQTGLSSPVGFEQGRFRFSEDSQGNRMVSNGFNNGQLFRGMDPATNSKLQSLNVQARTTLIQHRSGAIPYSDLKAIILALAAN